VSCTAKSQICSHRVRLVGACRRHRGVIRSKTNCNSQLISHPQRAFEKQTHDPSTPVSGVGPTSASVALAGPPETRGNLLRSSWRRSIPQREDVFARSPNRLGGKVRAARGSGRRIGKRPLSSRRTQSSAEEGRTAFGLAPAYRLLPAAYCQSNTDFVDYPGRRNRIQPYAELLLCALLMGHGFRVW
jgi:hypothetical protein